MHRPRWSPALRPGEGAAAAATPHLDDARLREYLDGLTDGGVGSTQVRRQLALRRQAMSGG